MYHFFRAFLVAILLISVIMLFSGCTALQRPEEYVFQAMNVADYRQTSEIAQKPTEYYEMRAGWAIGKHPSQRSVNTYFIAESLLHLGMSELLLRNGNGKVYSSWQVITIIGKGKNVAENYSVGLKVKF